MVSRSQASAVASIVPTCTVLINIQFRLVAPTGVNFCASYGAPERTRQFVCPVSKVHLPITSKSRCNDRAHFIHTFPITKGTSKYATYAPRSLKRDSVSMYSNCRTEGENKGKCQNASASTTTLNLKENKRAPASTMASIYTTFPSPCSSATDSNSSCSCSVTLTPLLSNCSSTSISNCKEGVSSPMKSSCETAQSPAIALKCRCR